MVCYLDCCGWREGSHGVLYIQPKSVWDQYGNGWAEVSPDRLIYPLPLPTSRGLSGTAIEPQTGDSCILHHVGMSSKASCFYMKRNIVDTKFVSANTLIDSGGRQGHLRGFPFLPKALAKGHISLLQIRMSLGRITREYKMHLRLRRRGCPLRRLLFLHDAMMPWCKI
jgi:hypothetical protein